MEFSRLLKHLKEFGRILFPVISIRIDSSFLRPLPRCAKGLDGFSAGDSTTLQSRYFKTQQSTQC